MRKTQSEPTAISAATTSCCNDSRCCAPVSPNQRSAFKVGRNDLCPCDSGLKFKKCCARFFK